MSTMLYEPSAFSLLLNGLLDTQQTQSHKLHNATNDKTQSRTGNVNLPCFDLFKYYNKTPQQKISQVLSS